MSDIVLIIDASGLLYRSFFALPPLTSPSGRPTGALYGFIRSILKVHQKISPSHIISVFDGPENKRSRIEIYPEYKATRKPTPPELIEQIQEAQKFCALQEIPSLSIPGVEADDTIASIVHLFPQKQIYICSADKDLAQLVSSHTSIINPAKDNAIIDKDMVEKEWGVPPEKLLDFFSLIGDSSDNVPGIEGIGPKTALSLLKEWNTLDNLLDHASIIPGKKGEKIQKGTEKALLSRQLITLDTSVDIPTDLSFYKQKEYNPDSLNAFFLENGFKTLLSLTSTPSKTTTSHTIVQTENDLRKFLYWLEQQTEVALDCETTSLDEHSAELVGIGIASNPTTIFYIDCSNKPHKIVSLLNETIQKKNISLIGHNIKYDLHVLTRYGLSLPSISFDTLIASWLLNSHERTHSLDELALRHFQIKKIPIESLIGKGKSERSMREVPVQDVARYCAEDVEYTLLLKEVFEKELTETHLDSLFYSIELPLIPILFSMENCGVYVNKQKLSLLEKTLDKEVHRIQQEIFEFAGREFNINSPKQLSEILFNEMGLPKLRKGKKALSTNAEIMEELSHLHPIAHKVLEYRQLEKLRSTYVTTLPKQIYEKTGRVHCHFIQSGTATGRLSCQDPNLQNIPVKSDLGKEIRAAFEPQNPDWVYVSADYSQIELRLLAHMCQDPALLHAFQNELDIHATTAAQLFSISIDQVTEEMRRKAKAVNFGIVYGQQAYGLARELKISTKEAQQFIDHYFAQYTHVQDAISKAKEKAHETGMAETLMGRRRLLPEINSSDFFVRSLQERLAINTPFQGTASDIIKKAMISIDKKLSGMNTKMILQIHDELIFEAPKDELDMLISLIRVEMESVMNISVPLRINISIGKNWKEC